MRLRELIFEGYPDALAEFSRVANPELVKTTISQYRQLVARHQFPSRDFNSGIDEGNIDYWRSQGWSKFHDAVTTLMQTPSETQSKNKHNTGNSVILHEDSIWFIVIPLDKDASCFHGRDTSWCTSKPLAMHFEKYFYIDDITLIYVINKTNTDRFAIVADFLNGSFEYLDRNNNSINTASFKKQTNIDASTIINLAKQSIHTSEIDISRKLYTLAKSKLSMLLSTSPLNHKEITRLLLITKDPELSTKYVVKYAAEVGRPVKIRGEILYAIAMYIDDEYSGFNIDDIQIVISSIDFHTIKMSTFKSILRDSPELLMQAYDQLSAQQQLVLDSRA